MLWEVCCCSGKGGAGVLGRVKGGAKKTARSSASSAIPIGRRYELERTRVGGLGGGGVVEHDAEGINESRECET